uniref:Uncharacterized protein n=1 Tax=Steinernema glaseri TaxID=37863 RepID=A0A1I8AES8_9BILA
MHRRQCALMVVDDVFFAEKTNRPPPTREHVAGGSGRRESSPPEFLDADQGIKRGDDDELQKDKPINLMSSFAIVHRAFEREQKRTHCSATGVRRNWKERSCRQDGKESKDKYLKYRLLKAYKWLKFESTAPKRFGGQMSQFLWTKNVYKGDMKTM